MTPERCVARNFLLIEQKAVRRVNPTESEPLGIGLAGRFTHTTNIE